MSDNEEEKIASIIVRGKRGATQNQAKTPHRRPDGTYIVSMDRFAKNYIYVKRYDELVKYIRDGYGVRMSVNGGPASLISSATILAQNPQLV